MAATRVQLIVPSRLRQPGLLRLRRWGGRKYAISDVGPNGAVTLVEGDGRLFAHVVHVDGDRFVEVTHAPMMVKGGIGTSLVVLRSTGRGDLRLRRVREFPNGTRRLDIAERSHGRVRRSSHWLFATGRRADAISTGEGLEIVFHSRTGATRRRWVTRYQPLSPGTTRVHTDVYDAGGQHIGSADSTRFPRGRVTRVWHVEHRRGNTQTFETRGPNGWEKGKVTTEGTTLEAEWEASGNVGPNDSGPTLGHSSTHIWQDYATGEAVFTASGRYLEKNGTVVSGASVQTSDGEGHSTEGGTVSFETDEGDSTWHWDIEDGEVKSVTVETSDTEGNTSTINRIQNPDGSVTITIDSRDSEGNWSHEEFTVSADGTVTDELVIDHEEEDDDDEEPSEEPTAEDETGEGEEEDEDDEDDEGDDGDGDDGDDDEDDEDDEDEGTDEEETPDGETADGGMPGDDGGDEGPPVPMGVGWASAVHTLGGGGPGRAPSGDDRTLGDVETASEQAPDIAGFLMSHAQSGGTGTPTGNDSGWGDSTSGEDHDPPDLDGAVPGHVVPSADETGWGDLNHPNALVASATRLLGAKTFSAAAAALVAAREIEGDL